MLVEVHAAPVNYVDLLVVGGTYQFLPALPFIPGKGPAGVVTALGRDGDQRRGSATGCWRWPNRAAMPRRSRCAPTSATDCRRRMSFTEAASLSLVYDTAWFALRERARLETGETVLVLGASGGVGQAAVQLAHAMGARVLAGILRPETGGSGAGSRRRRGDRSVAADLRDSLREQV